MLDLESRAILSKNETIGVIELLSSDFDLIGLSMGLFSSS